MLVKEIVKGILGPIFGGFWSHLHLYRYGAYLRQRVGRGPHTYDKESSFWRDLIGPRFHGGGERQLRIGDVVNLKDFQLTEWFPRCPGVYWTEEGTRRRRMGRGDIEAITSEYVVLGPKGKSYMVTGGVGTNRLLAHDSKDGRYRVLCATTSGICDAGIPLVVLEDVANRIQDLLSERHTRGVNITGRLVELPFEARETVVGAVGAELDDSLKDWLSTALHIPRYFVLVESTLQVTRKSSRDFRFQASAWTLFEGEMEESIVRSFTFAPFDPKRDEGPEEAADFIMKYVQEHGGTRIYTDFDEHVPRLQSVYSLGSIMDRTYDEELETNDKLRILAWGANIETISETRRSWKHLSGAQ